MFLSTSFLIKGKYETYILLILMLRLAFQVCHLRNLYLPSKPKPKDPPSSSDRLKTAKSELSADGFLGDEGPWRI